MQSILREKLLAHATALAEVSSVYRHESHRFVEAYFAWLEQAEKDIAGMRAPIGILLQAEKSMLSSVTDGFSPDYVQAETSMRKKQKAIAAHSLERVSREMQAAIERIDQTFDQLHDKLCHAVAVLATKNPTLYAKLHPDKHSVQEIWRALASVPETIPMFNYLSAKLTQSDREYLLFDILQNIASNTVCRELQKA